ncbi:hypothetical protein FS749_000328 [Ceratobasidium sp. UAMH 11750]|nr:hypothetical protein FS749_000328 [Ceratobasidium sp. UAMH 11750]
MAQSNNEGAKARKQALRVARREKADKINDVLVELQEKAYAMFEEAAQELDCDVEEVRKLFIANSAAHMHAKPTAWNGLVHEKSREWVDMKDTYSGGKYIQYVVERIKEEGLYEKMSEQDEARYVETAQKLRDSKLNAGSARTMMNRKTPGNVFTELDAMGHRLMHLHNATGIEGVLIAVRGNEKDGMSPVHFSSLKARTFLESYLKLECDHFVSLMECSAVGGASAVALRHRTETQVVKSNVRTALLDSLRKAAMSTGSDGSEPTITNPLIISAISYSDYISFVRQYKVEVFNWPMNGDKMVDPSNVGGHKILSAYLKRIESGEAGFRRITDAEWEEWKQARDEAEVVVPAKRPPRKRANPSADQQPNAKKARKEPSKAKAKPTTKTKSKGKKKAHDVETVSEGVAEPSSPRVPVDDVESTSSHCNNNDLGASTGAPSPPIVSLPPTTVTDADRTFAVTLPDSPPVEERFRITINRRAAASPAPPTPSTIVDSAPSSSPNFFLQPVTTQPRYNNSPLDCSQGSPSRGRRSYRGDPFINYTPDSMSPGGRVSRSNSLASRSNTPTRHARSQAKTHVSTTASLLGSSSAGLPSFSLLTNNVPHASEFFPLPTSHVFTPPQFGFEPPSGHFGPNSLDNQDVLLSSGWNFDGLHAPMLAGLAPESRSATPALSEFAAPDA